jgi:protein tyrosine phosphatase
MSTPIELIDFPLERMSRCTATEFKLLSFMTQTQYHVDKLYKNPEQFPLNRNPAFMTFNPTRVRLGNDDSIDNYINANMISVAGKRVVATQGPLTVTIYNFWRMV